MIESGHDVTRYALEKGKTEEEHGEVICIN